MPIALFLACCTLWITTAGAQQTYSLAELVAHALRHNAEVGEERWKAVEAATELQKANASRILPKFRFEALAGLVPEAKGDIFTFESDTSGLRPLGPFLRSEIKFTQPLYVFGASQLHRAAREGKAAAEAALAQKETDVALDIKELYYSVQLVHELQALVETLEDKIAGRLQDLEDGDLSLANQYKLKFALLEIERQGTRVRTQADLAHRALAWTAGIEADSPFVLDSPNLARVEATIPPLAELSGTTPSRRADWRRLQAGIAAKEGLRNGARGAFLPQLFVTGGMRYAVAPNRTDQHNPFIKDEYNLFNFGAAVGIRQSLEFGLLRAALAKREAEYRQLKAKESTGLQGIRLDLRRAYLEYQDADEELERMQQSRRLSRQWLREAQEAYDFDPEEEAKGLIEAVQAWANNEQAYFDAIFAHNITLARLEKAAALNLSGTR
jgi:outer membrane protein TolC